MVRIKRVYASPTAEDGFRVLVDGLWPRGLSRNAAALDLWLRDIAPSRELRTWFAHDPARWPAFNARYRKELSEAKRSAALKQLQEAERARGMVTLLFAARNEVHNHAVVLRELLEAPP